MKNTIIALLAIAPLTQGADLIADLKFDGNFTDSEGNLTFSNNDNRYNGDDGWTTATTVNDSEGCVSVAGKAAAWNGTFTDLPSTTDFAVSFFLNATELPTADATNPNWTAQWILGGDSSPDGGVKIGIGADGQIKVSLHNKGGGLNSGVNNVITIGDWYHIGVSFTESLWTVYINGTSVATATAGNPEKLISWKKTSLFEGKDTTSSNRYVGLVDDMQFYNVTNNTDAADIMRAQAARLVPEPTTATLSLLALAGLAARRRRR